MSTTSESARQSRHFPTVGFDESGNTGPDLLNRDQPVFVLASVSVPEADAANLLGLGGGPEFHSVSDRKSQLGRERMLTILESPLLGSDTVKVSVMHKPFMVTTKIVALLVEPIAATMRLDLYQDGMHLGLSNWLHASWPVLDPAGFDRISTAFVGWVRNPSPQTGRALAVALRPMAAHTPEVFDQILRTAADILERAPDYLAGSSDISDLDPAGPTLFSLLHEWCAQLGGLQVLHDDSKEIKRWIPHITRLSDASLPVGEFQVWNGHTLRYPLAVQDVTLAASESSAQIQLADLIAGSASIAYGSRIRPPKGRLRTFAKDVCRSRLPEWVIGSSVWPTTDFSPEDLGAVPGQTSWVIDRLANWGA